ncbi:MAG: CbiX/SirB N-terminal domain-containing protein [Nitrospinae bacterium]|nr:CbiX/SirB N-terminal domain-containing protein [Nitrospinota bacterium]MBF0633531.1 CbiX/SirB N-terminal domain-containing protein [Nitrospinota bacterium]
MKLRGIVLLAHGSRDAKWREPFDLLAGKIAKRLPDTAVRVSFLKDLEPDIYAAVDGLAKAGATHITVVPVFLAAGGHSGNDFPVMANRLSVEHPGVKFRWTEVIGSWEEVIEAMAVAVCAKEDGEC